MHDLRERYKEKIYTVKPLYKGTPKSDMTLNNNHHY